MSDRGGEEDCATTELFPALRPVVSNNNNANTNNNEASNMATASSSPSSGAIPSKALPPQPLSVNIPPPPMLIHDENTKNNGKTNNKNTNNNTNNDDHNDGAANAEAEAEGEAEANHDDFANSASTDCSALTLPTISTLTAATPLSALGTPPYRQRYRHQMQIQQLQQQMQEMHMQAMHAQSQTHTQAQQAHTQQHAQQWQQSQAVLALRDDTHSPCPPHNAAHTTTRTQQQQTTTAHAPQTHTATQPSTASCSSQAHEIFAGDLSFFCKEYDLYELFSRFGYVLKVRIKRSEKDGRTLMYGFVVMQQLAEAQAAVNALHGFRFMGRDMRVELSKTKNALPNSHSNNKKTPDFQVHVTFASYFPRDDVVLPRETLLRSIFEMFAHVKDVAIKEYITHPNVNKQEGFCFVTFFSPDDARCVVDCVNRRVFNGFIFSCSLSYHNPAELRPECLNTQNHTHGNQKNANVMPGGSDSSSHYDSANTITHPHMSTHGHYADNSHMHNISPTFSHSHTPSLPMAVPLAYPSLPPPPYAPLSVSLPLSHHAHSMSLSAPPRPLVYPSMHSPYPYMNTTADMSGNREITHTRAAMPSSPALMSSASGMHTNVHSSMPVSMHMHMPQHMSMSSSSSVASSLAPSIYGMPSAPQSHMHHGLSHPHTHMYAPQVMYSVEGAANSSSSPSVPHNSMYAPIM